MLFFGPFLVYVTGPYRFYGPFVKPKPAHSLKILDAVFQDVPFMDPREFESSAPVDEYPDRREDRLTAI